MKILHISTKDTGGASTASMRLHSALKNFNSPDLQSKMLLLWDNTGISKSDDTIHLYENEFPFLKKTGDYLSFLKLKYLKNKNPLDEQYIKSQFYHSFYYPETHKLIKWADIIHLHWINGFVNPFKFFKTVDKPVVWRFPDMTPFSGGNCYESGIFENNIHKFDRFLEQKKKIFSIHGKIYGQATTSEFKKKATEYQTFKEDNIFVIPNPLDTSLYSPKSKEEAKNSFKINTNKPVILFVAADVNNSRKGIHFLMEEKIQSEFTLVVAGTKNEKLSSYKNIIQLGKLNQEQLNFAYSMADLYVTPSIEEAFGQTTVEALYCGIPVVAFPTSGSKDIIENGTNGYIANDISVEGLYEAIKKALQHPFDRNQIVSLANSKYSPDIIVKQLIDMYKYILNND